MDEESADFAHRAEGPAAHPRAPSNDRYRTGLTLAPAAASDDD